MALDNFRKINITLNKANQHILEPQITKVGDVNGRELVVQLIDEGVIKDQTGVTLKLNWQHANGNQGSETFSPLDAKQGIFSVYYPENMLFRGTVTASISINESGKITNSLNFQIAVKGDVFDGSAVEVDGILFTLKDLKDQLDERDNSLDVLESRQSSVESHFNAIQQEMTDKDVISAPEIIAARNGEDTLSDRLNKEREFVFGKIDGDTVNVSEFGAVADYYLEDGSLNSNPTDNTKAFRDALSVSGKIKLSNKGGYYIKDTNGIELPLSGEIYGNNCRIVFEENGINLGDGTWSRPKIYDLDIFNINESLESTPKGKGLYSDNASIVYPIFDNVYIRGFDKGLSSISSTDKPNLTWGNLGRLRIEYCNIPLHLKNGWSNTVAIEELIINFNLNGGIFEDCNQIHRFSINKLVMESNGAKNQTDMSPFNFINCSNGEITIKDCYLENNGKYKVATSQEVTSFKNNGTKVQGHITGSDTKSWLLGGLVYSEDTGYITSYSLDNNSTFKFTDCNIDFLVDVQGVFISTNLLGLASFVNSNSSFNIEDVYLMNKGYSFPNMRKVFSGYGGSPVVNTKNLKNSGGGSQFNYDSVDIHGDKFSAPFKNREAYLTMTNYMPVGALEKKSIVFDKKTGTDNFVRVDDTDKTKLIINESGYYSFTSNLVFGVSSAEGVSVTFYKDSKVQQKTYLKDIILKTIYSPSALLDLKKGDVVTINVENLMNSGQGVAGTSSAETWIFVKKIV